MKPARQDLEQAFLADVVAHPDDPSLWLILADWLAEREDPRAELVRLTWQLQYEPDHADFATRQARVQELLAGGMPPVRPRLELGDFEFAWIPPGSFLIGSPDDEGGRSEDETRHRVTLTAPFWMGVYPVTQGQWQALTGNNPSSFARSRAGGLRAAERRRLPVERVTWDLARDFCARLGERLGRRVGLPTEAQWEWACRAGTTTPFHFGASLNGTQANTHGTRPYNTAEVGPYLGRPSAVGSYPPNAWGLYDTHGNVWEWCADAFRADFENLPAVDPLWDEPTPERRVLRGGSWPASPFRCRAAARYSKAPGETGDIVGLRVCFLA